MNPSRQRIVLEPDSGCLRVRAAGDEIGHGVEARGLAGEPLARIERAAREYRPVGGPMRQLDAVALAAQAQAELGARRRVGLAGTCELT